jgi:sulfite reductase beta subunit-like hemoprotein
MTDIDVDQWKKVQEMFLESSKEKKRIIMIRESQEILKFVHSDREEIVKSIHKITNPQEDARKVYEDNKERTDFVLLVDRKGVERFFGEVQESWNPDEDLDEYVYKMYAKLDEYKDEIVTYPGPARKTLGLRWKLAMSYPQAKKFVNKYIPRDSVVVIAIFEDSNLIWGSLVLGFDDKGKITLITTIEKSKIAEDWKKEYKNIIKWAEEKFNKCSLGLFVDKRSMEMILKSRGKLATIRGLSREGKAIVYPIPELLQCQLRI